MKKIITIGILFLGIITLAGCGQQQTGQTKQSSSNQNFEPATSETSEWKTYSSTKLSIDFEYPTNYIIMDLLDNDEKAILIGDKKFPKPDIAPNYNAPIKISTYKIGRAHV